MNRRTLERTKIVRGTGLKNSVLTGVSSVRRVTWMILRTGPVSALSSLSCTLYKISVYRWIFCGEFSIFNGNGSLYTFAIDGIMKPVPPTLQCESGLHYCLVFKTVHTFHTFLYVFLNPKKLLFVSF